MFVHCGIFFFGNYSQCGNHSQEDLAKFWLQAKILKKKFKNHPSITFINTYGD
jgi:hypothetical protein